MKKIKLINRFIYALEAFKEGPPPVSIPLAPPPYIATRPDIRTIKGYVTGWYPERTRAEIEVAREIGVELLKRGCIRFTEDGPTMALIGQVCVLSPEEAER